MLTSAFICDLLSFRNHAELAVHLSTFFSPQKHRSDSHLLYNNTYLHQIPHYPHPSITSYPLINSSHMANKQQQQPNICQATVHSGVFPHSLMQWLIGFRNWFEGWKGELSSSLERRRKKIERAEDGCLNGAEPASYFLSALWLAHGFYGTIYSPPVTPSSAWRFTVNASL